MCHTCKKLLDDEEQYTTLTEYIYAKYVIRNKQEGNSKIKNYLNL